MSVQQCLWLIRFENTKGGTVMRGKLPNTLAIVFTALYLFTKDFSIKSPSPYSFYLTRLAVPDAFGEVMIISKAQWVGALNRFGKLPGRTKVRSMLLPHQLALFFNGISIQNVWMGRGRFFSMKVSGPSSNFGLACGGFLPCSANWSVAS